MHIPRLLTLLVALAAAAVMIVVGLQIVQPDRPLIVEAGFDRAAITPNADGDSDAAVFTYELSRNAAVSLVFTDESGTEYSFRSDEARTPGVYSVVFSGVVHGYTLPEENITAEVDRRLLQDGAYTWRFTATPQEGDPQEITGTLTVQDADSALPLLPGLTVYNRTFTPNQDGIADRLQIYVFVNKAAALTAYLTGDDGSIYYIAERNEGTLPGEAGDHYFDYDGGIDAGSEPPKDGQYTLIIEAEDAEGQRVIRQETVTVLNGGTPIGGIYTQTTGTTIFYDTMPYDNAYFSDIEGLGEPVPVPEGVEGTITSKTVLEGEMLVFRVTISNDGDVGLRTAGPPPGTVYQQDQRASSLGFYAESGAWRVGLECDTADASYPWRWAIGADAVLETFEVDGETYQYLPPGAQAVVWGAVRLTDPIASRNPQQCFVGLIHEDVEVSAPFIDPRWVEIVPAPGSETPPTTTQDGDS